MAIKEKKEYTLKGNPKVYFNKSIIVQQRAFDERYAEKKLNQSCSTLIKAGYCSGCHECHLCALQAAHEETLKAISNPAEKQRRYEVWKQYHTEHEAHQNYGVSKKFDGKGHKTETWWKGMDGK